MYSLNFPKVIKHYLHTWLAPLRYAWLTSLAKPLDFVKDDVFTGFRAEVLELSRYNCQKIVLQAILNKAFSTGDNSTIYIVNSDRFITPTYFYNESEGYPAIYLFNEGSGSAPSIYNESEFGQTFDFIVYVPEVIYETNLIRVKGIVDLYRAAGPNYSIISY